MVVQPLLLEPDHFCGVAPDGQVAWKLHEAWTAVAMAPARKRVGFMLECREGSFSVV